MGKSYVDYGKKIADASTIELLKYVRFVLHWYEKDYSFEAAEKFMQNYYQSKIDAHFENDRLMFLNLPEELQNRIDDETYQIVNNTYVDAFMQGYLLGNKDMQELISLLAEPIATAENFEIERELGLQEQMRTQVKHDERMERRESLQKEPVQAKHDDGVPF